MPILSLGRFSDLASRPMNGFFLGKDSWRNRIVHPFRWRLIATVIALGTTSVVQGTPPQYLQLPSAGGGATSWSSSSGTVGTNAGNTVATTNGGGAAAGFSLVGQTYSLISDAYFDVNVLGAGTYTLGATAATIDLNGHALTIHALPGQTVLLGAKLTNSLTVGGLTVSGGGAMLLDNSASQYASGMDIGALAVDGATVTLPANLTFGLLNDGAGGSYASINLTNAAALVLGDGTAIGSRSIPSSVAISLGTGAIKLAGGGGTASLTPNFSLTSTTDILTLDTNGGTLRVYGNRVNSSPGSEVTLNVHDTAGTTGTLILYGSQNASPGGNDYVSSNVTVASGTLQLQLDAGDYADQSLGNIAMTGGTITGAGYAYDVTMAGASQLSTTSLNLNSLTMAGSAKSTGVVSLTGDLNLTETAVFSPPASASPTILASNFNANSGTPHDVVSFDGTNVSELAVTGQPDIANLEIDLLLAAGTYATGTQNRTIIAAGYAGTAPAVAPKWNIAGVYRDAGHTQPATGDEIVLSLSPSGNDSNLGFTINRTLYVVTSATPNYIVPFTPIPPAVNSINRTGATPTNATTVGFTATFSEAVTGVDPTDFTVTTTGTAAGTIASVTGSGAVYTVTVNAVSGNGTLRLDLKNSGTGITNAETTAISTGFTGGQSYAIDATAPTAPSGFAALATGGTIALGWTNPADSDFSSCTIRRSTSAFPTTISSGTAVGAGLTGTSFNQTSLADGPYYYALFALDTAGNVSLAATASATVDTVTAAPVLSAPGSGATDNASFAIGFTLPETAAAGSLKLTFTRTGGTVDTGSPHVLTLSNGLAGSGGHTASLNAANFSADANVVSITGSAALVHGAIYTVTLSYQDVFGNPAATVANTNITYDSTTGTPVLTTPATNGADNASFAVAFTLPEAAAPGSVSLTFTRTGGTADAASPHVLTLVDGFASAGAHSAMLNAANFSTDLNIFAVSGGAALVDGTRYTVTLAYQDAVGNPTASAASTGVTYDISVATPAAPTLNVGSDTGSSPSDGITNDTTPRIEGTAEANGMLAVYIDSTFSLSLALDGTGNWWFRPSPALSEGVHTITTQVTDWAGNISAVSAPLSITIDTTAPVITSAASAGGTYNAAFSYTVTASGSAVAYSATSLPAGLSINSGTGVISGTPTLAGNYTVSLGATDAAGNTGSASLALAIARITPVITWPAPSAIQHGTALGSTQLNATASVAGSFVYSPISGTILEIGTQTLNVTFTPADTTNYAGATAQQTITVNPIAPTIISSPANRVVAPGDNTSFSVAASGYPVPTYQWQKLPAGSGTWINLSDGGNYSGTTTATLLIHNATLALNDDQFRCMVTNTAGAVASNPALLTVTTATIAPSEATISFTIE